MEENVIENNQNKESIINKENILLLAGCLVLGLLVDVLFYNKSLGISYPIFVLAFYGILMWKIRKSIVIKLNFEWLLTIPILALACSYFIYSNVIFRILNFLAIPMLIFIQTTLIASKNKYQWHSIKFLEDLCISIFVRPFENIPKPFQMIEEIISNRIKNKKVTVASKVLLGLLISIPIVVMVIALLASADQVFQHFTENIFSFFNNIKSDEAIIRTLIILFFSFTFFSYIWSIAYSKIYEAKEENANVYMTDKIIMITVLSVINLIYIFFVFIQFAYLFGGANYALVPGFSHSEYARRGFFELVAVTLINLSILMVSLNFTKQGSKITNRISQILNSFLVVCTAIMLYSAHFRMSLYEQEYGYTYLRILTHAFMVFIFVLLLLALYKIWRENFSLVKAYIIVTIAAYVVVNYVNIDVIIARNNYERFQKTRQIDVGYLNILSYDAVPWMVELMNNKNKNIAVESQNSLYDKKKMLLSKNDWQSFNISEFRAKQQLSKLNLKYQKISLDEEIKSER
ncbi:MAG: DUF4153 domain-containing protein [Ignavibacteriales bacterium]